MPPKGALETGEATGELTDEQMEEESAYRQEFLDDVSPKLGFEIADLLSPEAEARIVGDGPHRKAA